MGARRKFSAEFKREAVALTAQPDVSVAQVARDLGLTFKLRTLGVKTPVFTSVR